MGLGTAKVENMTIVMGVILLVIQHLPSHLERAGEMGTGRGGVQPILVQEPAVVRPRTRHREVLRGRKGGRRWKDLLDAMQDLRRLGEECRELRNRWQG